MPTFPISFPPKTPATERLTLDHRQAAMISPFSLAQQTVHTASQWKLEWTWASMSHADAQALGGWLDSLRGQIGSFKYSPRQAVGAMPTGRTLATAGFPYTNALNSAGWGNNAATNLRTGQYFQVGDQLLRITSAPTTADATGRALIEFEPQLRATYAVGAPLNFVNPTGTFRLTTKDAGFTLDPDRMPSFGNLTAVEVVA